MDHGIPESSACDRCGRARATRELPVTQVVIPFLVTITRQQPVPAELGWVDLETPTGAVSLCPECAQKPGLGYDGADDAQGS